MNMCIYEAYVHLLPGTLGGKGFLAMAQVWVGGCPVGLTSGDRRNSKERPKPAGLPIFCHPEDFIVID